MPRQPHIYSPLQSETSAHGLERRGTSFRLVLPRHMEDKHGSNGGSLPCNQGDRHDRFAVQSGWGSMPDRGGSHFGNSDDRNRRGEICQQIHIACTEHVVDQLVAQIKTTSSGSGSAENTPVTASDGVVKRCRMVLVTGSRVRRERVCSSAADDRTNQRDSQDSVRRVQDHGIGEPPANRPGN